MSDNEEEPVSQINFVPCLFFMKRGVAVANPAKVTLTQEELAKVINETRGELSDLEHDEDQDEDGNDESMEVSDTETAAPARASGNPSNPDDIYNFDNYDNEDGSQVAGISDIVCLENEHEIDEDDEDSEAEDDIIKPEDNILLVGHVDEDAASLEVFVYNEEESSFYVHHDFLLPSFPLCIEWMNYDPETKDAGNICAIGSMDPIITLWDLDIQDSLEPILKLGAKKNRRKNIEAFGHKNAVLDLSWNAQFPHILASSSVDQTVILWDMDDAQPHTTITAFAEKVQTIQFHSSDANNLLAGSCDGTVKLFDCRDPESGIKTWNFNGEIERVLWDPTDSNCFFASSNLGDVFYVDVRQEAQLWGEKMHEKEVAGLSVNNSCRSMLTTSSADGSLKVWKYDRSGAQFVHEEETGIGQIQCMGTSPENPFTVAIGGDNKNKNLRLINVGDYDNVKRAFQL